MSIWKTSSSLSEKPWGTIESFDTPWGIYGKIINLKAGHRTSLKYYKGKQEILYCLQGEAQIDAPNENEFGELMPGGGSIFHLKKGEAILVQPENPYRIMAFIDCILVETTYGDMSDYVMLDDDYGRLQVE